MNDFGTKREAPNRSRIKLDHYDVAVCFIILIAALVEIFLADHFLLKNAEPVARYGLWALVGIAGSMFALTGYRSRPREW